MSLKNSNAGAGYKSGPVILDFNFWNILQLKFHTLVKPYSALPSIHFNFVNYLRSPVWCSSQIDPIRPNVHIPWDILMYLSTSCVDIKSLLQTLSLPVTCPETAGTTRHNKLDYDDNNKKYQHTMYYIQSAEYINIITVSQSIKHKTIKFSKHCTCSINLFN